MADEHLGHEGQEPMEYLENTIQNIQSLLNRSRYISKEIKQNIETELQDLRDCFKHQDDQVSFLYSEIQQLKSQLYKEKRSYRDALVSISPPELPTPVPLPPKQDNVLLIFPSSDASSPVDKLLTSSIDPIKEGITVNQKKNISNGGVLLSCSNKEDLVKLQATLEKNLGDKVNIKVPLKKRPRLFLRNLSDDLESNEIEEIISTQNSFIKEHLDSIANEEERRNALKIVFPIHSRTKEKQHWILEVSPILYKIIQQHGRLLYFKWERIIVTDFISVPRCKKCARIGHTVKYCRASAPTCATCAKEHPSDSCPKNSMTCRNCLQENKTKGTMYRIDHDAFDNSCPTFLKAKEITKSRIDYG